MCMDILYKRQGMQMMKNQQQMQYEQLMMTLDKELQIYQSKKSTQKIPESKISDLQQKIKKLTNLLKKIQEKLKSQMRKKNENQYDIKNRIRNHAFALQKMQNRFKSLQTNSYEAEKQQLFRHKNMTEIQLQDFKRAENHRMRIYGIDKQAEQVHGIVTDTYAQLHGQGRKLKQIEDDVEGFDHDLTINEQLFRVISNRTLVTKLIIVLLVVFMGFADIMVLIIKLL